MVPQNEDELCAFVAALTGASSTEPPERIQSLWGGYGELVRIRLHGSAHASVVVKWAKPPRRGTELHARFATDVSHARKARSYEVESAFYASVAARCDDTCRVAKLLGQASGDGEWLFVLEDLDHAGFARRNRDPEGDDLRSCLAWLASFHARFMGVRAREAGLWPTGTYWHLDTRRDELEKAAKRDASLPARASALDRKLRMATHQTLVHGDAKPANFCFAQRGAEVAAVDFQYVGGGPGIRDVAYLLHGASERATAEALDLYFGYLSKWSTGHDVEAEWRDLYDVAIRDFERFLVGWRG